jgi:CBS domain-containing protein
MNAADVMVSKVITVGPDATVQEVAEILLKNKISAVPVVSQGGKILGIVSEGDMLRRVESHTLRHRSWWLQLFTASATLRDEFVKSHSHKVVDVMTPKVLTVSPETPLGEIASVLEKNGIKRVPVVKDGKLVGIVSRANLLQAIATGKSVKMTRLRWTRSRWFIHTGRANSRQRRPDSRTFDQAVAIENGMDRADRRASKDTVPIAVTGNYFRDNWLTPLYQPARALDAPRSLSIRIRRAATDGQ